MRCGAPSTCLDYGFLTDRRSAMPDGIALFFFPPADHQDRVSEFCSAPKMMPCVWVAGRDCGAEALRRWVGCSFSGFGMGGRRGRTNLKRLPWFGLDVTLICPP